jgi:uncharacterized protein (UPF0264 family)
VVELLVSVRSVGEAEAAFDGGAALIDVKEPSRGSLGRPDESTVRAVIQWVAGRRQVSAALGELIEAPSPFPAAGLCYAKWGLAGCRRQATWGRDLAAARQRLQRLNPGCRPVAVAYADWRRADSPSPAHLCELAREEAFGALLLDTWAKDGTTLLDWLSPPAVGELCARCRERRVSVALAGSLGPEQIQTLLPSQPDWFAVRGAVCQDGRRSSAIDAGKVRSLVDLLSRPAKAASRES